MSIAIAIAIAIDKVTEVLLADGWHTVNNNSFGLDSYEYLSGRQLFVAAAASPRQGTRCGPDAWH